jgi:putative transcriptional regulator
MAVRINIDQMLVKRRLSLVELSDRTGISVRHLTLLRDQHAVAVRLKTMEALCAALKCTPGDLFSLIDDAEPNE